MQGTLRSYADDAALIVFNVFRVAGALARFFCAIGKASRLALNAKKCAIVPLWACEFGAIKAWLRNNVPRWTDFKICDCAKCLGFLVGPGAGNSDWLRAMSKAVDMSRLIKSLGPPKFHSFVLHQMFGVSQVQFVAQFRTPLDEIGKREVCMIRNLIGGPGLWAECALFHNLTELGFPVDIKSIVLVAEAARSRTALKLSSCMHKGIDGINYAVKDIDAFLTRPFPNWKDNCSAAALSNAGRSVRNSDLCKVRYEGDLDRCCGDGGLQKHIYNSLKENKIVFSPVGFLQAKLCRWYSSEDASRFAQIGTRRQKCLVGKVPPCVILACW